MNSITPPRFAGIRRLVLKEELQQSGLTEQRLFEKYGDEWQYSDKINYSAVHLDKEAGERNSIPLEPQGHVALINSGGDYYVVSSKDLTLYNKLNGSAQEKMGQLFNQSKSIVGQMLWPDPNKTINDAVAELITSA